MKHRVDHFFIAAACFMLLVEVFSLGRAIRGVPPEAFDFRQLYTAGWMLRSGLAHQIYDPQITEQVQNAVVSKHEGVLPFNHPAFEAVLFAPLTIFSFRTAYYLMLSLNAFFLVLCYVLFLKNFRLRNQWLFLPEALFVCFLPFAIALVQGQDSIVLTVLLGLSGIALDRGRHQLAGLLLALGLFKFQFILPIIVLYLIWRNWDLLRGFLVGAVGIALLSFAVTGLGATKAFARSLVAMGAGLSPERQDLYGIHPLAMPNLRGLLYAVAGAKAGFGVVAIASLLALFLAVRKRQSFPTATIFALLVSYHCFYHDLSILSVPVAALLSREPQHASLRALSLSALLAPSAIYGLGLGPWVMSLLLVALLLAVVFSRDLPSSSLGSPSPTNFPS